MALSRRTLHHKKGRLVTAVCQAVKEHTGLDPELSTSGGTSDGRFISLYDVDVVEVGPVNKTIHKINEELLLTDIPTLEEIYFRTVELLLIEGKAKNTAAG